MLMDKKDRGARQARKTGTAQKMTAAAMVLVAKTGAALAAGAVRKTGAAVPALFAAVFLVAGCTYPYERTYPVLTEEEELSAAPCPACGQRRFSRHAAVVGQRSD